jgi:hypothetical protein
MLCRRSGIPKQPNLLLYILKIRCHGGSTEAGEPCDSSGPLFMRTNHILLRLAGGPLPSFIHGPIYLPVCTICHIFLLILSI